MEKENTLVCQCCGMPLTEEDFAKNADGSVNKDYCKYCLENGEFKYNSIEEIITACVPFLVQSGFTKEQAEKHLRDTLPELKYWKK